MINYIWKMAKLFMYTSFLNISPNVIDYSRSPSKKLISQGEIFKK